MSGERLTFNGERVSEGIIFHAKSAESAKNSKNVIAREVAASAFSRRSETCDFSSASVNSMEIKTLCSLRSLREI